MFIPNREILDEYRTSTKSEEWISTFRSFELSQKLLQATWNKDAEKVAELLENAHDRAGNRTYNNEYQDKPALVIELKYDKTVETAMSQIRQKNYPERLEHYKGNILLIGIDYDRNIPGSKAGFKHHVCRIEEA